MQVAAIAAGRYLGLFADRMTTRLVERRGAIDRHVSCFDGLSDEF